jgi:hypothetical protein
MERVRIPADIAQPDRILAGLTARQLAILVLAGLPAGLLLLARPLVPLPVATALAALPPSRPNLGGSARLCPERSGSSRLCRLDGASTAARCAWPGGLGRRSAPLGTNDSSRIP